MKKAICILLALMLCLGLCACGEDGSAAAKDYSGSPFVGEWCTMDTYSYFGGTRILCSNSCLFRADGTGSILLQSGNIDFTWKPSDDEQLVSVTASSRTMTARLKNSDGITSLVISGEDYYKAVDTCEVCEGLPSETWQNISPSGVLSDAVFKDDGTLTVKGETYTWKSVCLTSGHYIQIADYGIVKYEAEEGILNVFDTVYHSSSYKCKSCQVIAETKWSVSGDESLYPHPTLLENNKIIIDGEEYSWRCACSEGNRIGVIGYGTLGYVLEDDRLEFSGWHSDIPFTYSYTAASN